MRMSDVSDHHDGGDDIYDEPHEWLQLFREQNLERERIRGERTLYEESEGPFLLVRYELVLVIQTIDASGRGALTPLQKTTWTP